MYVTADPRTRAGELHVLASAGYMYNLRTDPFERADVTSNTYWDWTLDRAFLVMPAVAIVAEFLKTFVDFPPRMEAASFTIDQVQEKLEASISSGR